MSLDPLAQRRIVLWCPYVHWHLAPTVASKVLGQMGSCKYQWFQRVIAKYRDNVFVYCDALHTSMVHYRGDVLAPLTNADARKEITLKEALRWNELNGFGIKCENFINRPEQIQPNDIIFTFSAYFLDSPMTGGAQHGDLFKVFSREDVFKVAHLTHYVFGLGHLAENLKRFNVQMLCYESNLAKYKFFKRYVPHVRNVTIIPFAVQSRFTAIKPFEMRLNRCIATGGISFHKVSPNLMEFFFEYSCNNFYPLRVLLQQNAAALGDYIHVKMGIYNKSMDDAMVSSVSGLAWSDLLERPVGDIAQIDAGKKISYYSEDIATTYNNYRFSYVSDEIQHAPALGFFESMACGAVPIGIDDAIYRDIGLVKNVHYLPFDGSFGGLMRTLIQAQNAPDSVRHIPTNNEKLVKSFSEERVSELFVQKLSAEFGSWLSTRRSALRVAQTSPLRTAVAA